MKFAFVTDELPVTGLAGHLAFNVAVIEWLQSHGHEVVILLSRPRFALPVQRYHLVPVFGPGVADWGGVLVSYRPSDVMPIIARNVLGRLPAAMAEWLRRRGRARDYGMVDAVLGAFITPEQSEWCVRRLLEMRPDAVLIDTIFRAPILADPRLAGINSVILANDVFHQRHRALASAGYQVHPAVLTREIEAALLRSARHVAAIQPEEAAEIRAMCPDVDVATTPMPALICPRPISVVREANRLVFVGSDTLPNLDGLRWFLNDVWPRLLAWRPEISLDLVGSCARSLGRLPQHVYRTGQIRHLEVILHKASLAISPLRVGTGLKIKMLDYARHGLKTVATPISLQGFARDARAPFIAASDAASFCIAIQKSLGEKPSAHEEQEALTYVEKHYGIEQNFIGLAEALGLPVKLSAS